MTSSRPVSSNRSRGGNGRATEYYVPAEYYERLAVETEEQKRLTRAELLEWLIEHVAPILRPGEVLHIPDPDDGTPIACSRPEHLVQ
jgi:hypothetical protein